MTCESERFRPAIEVLSLYSDVAHHDMLKGKPITPEQVHSIVTTYLVKRQGRVNAFAGNILAKIFLDTLPKPQNVTPTKAVEVPSRTIDEPLAATHLSFLNALKKPFQLVGIKL